MNDISTDHNLRTNHFTVKIFPVVIIGEKERDGENDLLKGLDVLGF